MARAQGIPAEVFSSCLAIVSAVMVGGLFLWPALRYGTGYHTVKDPAISRLLQAFTEDVFIFSLLVYIAHQSFLDDALYKSTYLLTYTA